MGKIFAFHGGIHPPENKKQSTRTPIRTAPIPAVLTVPLQQHIGAPAKATVQPGQQVLKGQVIALAQGRISASVHAPTSGTVIEIGPKPVPHASGLEAPCVVIESDGQDTWIEHKGLEDYTALKKNELIDFIRHHGISGMGGAGFPTDVKLHLGDDHIVNTLIINAAECEPYITADDMLMRERAEQIVGGIEIINHLIRPSHIIIGIEDNKSHAIRELEAATKQSRVAMDVAVVPTKYPSGGEKQLIKLLTDVEVPSGKLPADVGIVCQNVGTAAAIHQAVHEGKPLISRIVTVTGEGVAKPQNFEALIGTPFETLLKAADVQPSMNRLVVGGPMMGYTIDDASIPVVKTSNCIIAATHDEMPPAPPAMACIRCGMCEQVCPAELLPQQLHWFAKSREFDKAKHHNLFDCIECGACSYVCPSNIPLVQYYRFAKSEIREEEAEQRKAEQARMRFEARQARQQREKDEKEARRRERAEQAAKNQAAKAKKAAAPSSDKAASKTDAPAADVKKLKTDAAIARTKLKKAQTALAKAQEEGQTDLAALETAITEAQAAADKANQALEAAEKGNASAKPANAQPDLKQLKTQAAVARTKLKKAQQALKMAEEKGLDGVDEMRATVTELTAKAEAAQSAFEAAESGGSDSAAGGNPKLDGLKEDMEKALKTYEKSKKALETAVANESPAAEKMKAGVEKLKGKYEAAKAEYDKAAAESGSESSNSAEQSAEAPVDLKALKQSVSIMRTKLKKAEKALEEAEPSSDDAKAAQDEVERLRTAHDEAKAAFDKAESAKVEAAKANGVDLKQLKIDAAMARAAVTKLERAIKKQQEESPDADISELQSDLAAAQANAEQLSQTLSQYE
jgi:electron transport complex protein RnfC